MLKPPAYSVCFPLDIFRKKKHPKPKHRKQKKQIRRCSSCCNKGCTVSTINILHTVITRKHKRKDHTKVLAQVAIMVANLCNSRKVRIFRNKRIKPRVGSVSCRCERFSKQQPTGTGGTEGFEGEKGVGVGLGWWKECVYHSLKLTHSLKRQMLKMIFLFQRWDVLVPWRVYTWIF